MKVLKSIPESHVDILEAKCFPHVATMRPDGLISNHPVCLIWDGAHIRFSTTKSRRKFRNLSTDDRISLSIPDPENIWRYLEVRGRATMEEDLDRSFIDSIAKKYMGQAVYPFDPPDAERVTVTVHVEQVSAVAVHANVGDGRPPADWSN